MSNEILNLDFDDIYAALGSLTPVAQQLNNVRNQFTDRIKGIEQKLQSLNLGVTAFIILDAYPPNSKLGWMKEKNKWGLYIIYDRLGDNKVQLINASFKMRVEALKRMPDLIIELKKEIYKVIAKINNNIIEEE